jgi:hypothetical protein
MTASRYKFFIDKTAPHTPATKEQVVVGAKFKYQNDEYTVTGVADSNACLVSVVGMRTRTAIVDINQLTKLGSDYKLIE